MRKFFAVVLVLVLSVTALVSLAACNFEEDGITITFYHTMGQGLRNVLEEYIAEFNKIYPDIHIEHTQVGDYDAVRNKVNVDISTGSEPNIAYCYPDHVAGYNIAKAVMEMDSYIESTGTVEAGKFGNTEEMPIGLTEAQIKDLQDGGFYEEGRQFAAKEDGSTPMYTLPFSKSTEVLFYNKTFFEANSSKIDVPTHWWCTESCPAECHSSMEYVCKTILEITKDSGKDIIPLGYDSEANWFISMAEQFATLDPEHKSLYTTAEGDATDHYLFNNDTMKEFMTRINGWYSKNYFTTKALNSNKYTSNLFKNQESFMSIGSSAGASNQAPQTVDGKYPFDVGITIIPQVNPDAPKVISQGPSVCIFNKASEDEMLASWLFVKFLVTNTTFQAKFSQTSGYVPVLASVNNDPVYSAFLAAADGGDGITALSAKVCVQQAHAYYTSPAFNGSSKARDEVGSLLVKCVAFSGNDIAAQINTAFEEAIKTCQKNK